MSSFGSRLREERERRGMNQTEFGALGGVKRLAQANYEADKRDPDIKYLMALAGEGVDVLYVVTGVREEKREEWLSAQAQVLLVLTTMLDFEADAMEALIRLVMEEKSKGGAVALVQKLEDFLSNSPRIMMMTGSPAVIADNIELLEKLLLRVPRDLPRERRARVIATLYRSFKASGKIDESTVEDVVSLAAE